MHLLPSKRSKVLVQAELKQDVLQILKQNVLKPLNIEIENVSSQQLWEMFYTSIGSSVGSIS